MTLNTLQGHDHRRLTECNYLIGVDEAGRGALAGPVVAAACVLDRQFFETKEAVLLSAEINDSKQLTAHARAAQMERVERLRMRGFLDVAVAEATVEEISALNILGATRLAMQRALEALAARADGWELCREEATGPLFVQNGSKLTCLVDGRPLRPFPYAHEGIVKGDSLSLSIAMASIAAKVARDRALVALAKSFPGYGLEQHKGYGTAMHRLAIRRLGPSSVHREHFLRKILTP
mgnify:CR=1 FL=1